MTDDPWRRASRALLAKTIGELAFEAMLDPEPLGGDRHALRLPGATYTFLARRTAFGGWLVEPGSARRTATGILGDDVGQVAEDVRQFLVDAAPAVGIAPATLAGYLNEVTATLTADVAMAATARPAAELAEFGHAELEGHLTGHPWLVANKGRVGFSAEDLAAYAPESRRPLRLPWLAVHRGLAEFRGTPELSERGVRDRELAPETVHAFEELLRGRGLDPDAYVWLPAHPWQVDHVVRTLWAPELATDRIVELGEAPDRYLPTQSVRTMSNVDDPGRFQVKLPLRVLNTAVWRGIPPHCTLAAPVVTQWLRGLWRADKLLAEWGTVLLGEVASVTVRHPFLSSVDGVPYTWLETLGCVWREPVEPALAPGERAWPLAAVLHVDPDGRPLVGEYVARAGGDAEAWLAALLRALLRPLLHVLYRYGITVNPHGENVLVIVGPDGLPRRAVLKDLVDDVNVSAEPVPERGPEPDSHDRVLPRKPWRVLRQYLVDALLVGVLRPLAVLLAEHHGLREERLWGLVRGEVESYRRRHPDLADRMAEGDLLSPTFARYPLNGDRLLQTGYAELPHRHAIQPRGEIPNPLHRVATLPPPDGW
ncbi:Siderophore synthetase component [Streptoalloteichus tenebrarius]|uniref:Siderophore synthetase component n=1 Tax=Streptoalloteichus tenebrarius (strain ATCC 17920 / DSM 40477 / JCM 4838 / CBS 697.72 / NBRC 16177 / NCIMB 11028 / NRRL B-12390 / A12253. 1 / ISP 5477) TaxID=1933 RepID=A0ABT1HSE0_STRSD|nr:IucA/IucC family protein [Streptoalloteichus tenebrarius]MCP2258412.1 Siderophore synthetase component [Streptoalloteichus tenebrarius]BFF03582.1 IucA/IucC family protein [Streptoalloteichus tenebrarius]